VDTGISGAASAGELDGGVKTSVVLLAFQPCAPPFLLQFFCLARAWEP